MSEIYKRVREFKKRYPWTITWFRLKKHSKILDHHINPDEKILYVFAGQRSESNLDIFQTCVAALTDKRLVIGQKRVTWGYHFVSITPDMFNDLEVNMGIIWGRVVIDTIKEVVTISNLDKKSLDEIETAITTYMMREKRRHRKTDS